MPKHSNSQTKRLNYLEFRLYFTGQISRADLIQRFELSEAAATRDLALYRAEAPENLEFNSATKTYKLAKTFSTKYLSDISPTQLLYALIHGAGNDFGTTPESLVPCEFPGLIDAPPAGVLAATSRAICQNSVLRIEYLSESGNHGPREIVPLHIAAAGHKWLVRAFCRRKQIFCDFLLNRIKNAEVIPDSVPLPAEDRSHDDEWNRMLKLELIPHPATSSQQQEMTVLEYQMTEGIRILRIRASLAAYVLRLWSVDCSPDGGLEHCSLRLKNLIVLHDVENAFLAPGFKRPERP